MSMYGSQKRKVSIDVNDASDSKSKSKDTKYLNDQCDDYTVEFSDPNKKKKFESELIGYTGINPKLYQPTGVTWINRPENRYKTYNKFTTLFGYAYSEWKILLDDGILNVLDLPKPFYTFWNKGLDVYLPAANIDFEKSKTYSVAFKSHYCKTHPFKCEGDGECEIVYTAEKGDSMKFFIAGILKINKGQYSSWYIDINEGNCIESPTSDTSMASTLTLGFAENIDVYELSNCNHLNCTVGEEINDLGLPTTYKKCTRINLKYKLESERHNRKRCFAFGSGIKVKYATTNNTLYATTFKISEMYIICDSS